MSPQSPQFLTSDCPSICPTAHGVDLWSALFSVSPTLRGTSFYYFCPYLFTSVIIVLSLGVYLSSPPHISAAPFPPCNTVPDIE